MQVAVWDTYVTKKDGNIMHFDIIVPVDLTQKEKIFGYGQLYLASKGQGGQELSSKQCKYCHFEHLQAFMEKDILQKGYYIIEMNGC